MKRGNLTLLRMRVILGDKTRAFLDTSALFAAIWSADGGGRMILKLGEAGVVQVLVSSQVLAEIEDVLRRKLPEALPRLALLLDRCGAAVVKDVDRALLARCRALVLHAGDARVLAEAWTCGMDYFVTLDKAHFLDNPGLVPEALPFQLGTPGDFLAWYRDRLRGLGD